MEAADFVKVPFLSLTPQAWQQMVSAWGWPAYRGKQVLKWVYDRAIVDPEKMSDLSKIDRAKLAEMIDFAPATVVSRQISEDGTMKLLMEWPAVDGSGGSAAQAETVMIPDGDRRTACVSSQVGCPVGCKFCASGVGGVKGNLTAAQIIEQVLQLNLMLAAKNEHIDHIVFMGMGEPLANYVAVMDAIARLHEPQCFNISCRKITISTVGVPPKMRELAAEEMPINLAISLHAPTEALRRTLIPWAEHFALQDILSAAREYFDRTGREITLEYILLSGVNDQPQHARELSKLCKTLRANVNLIRYNEVEGLGFKRPLSQDVVQFQEVLRANGVNAHTRKSRGRDIDAACGQLRKRQAEAGGGLVNLTANKREL